MVPSEKPHATIAVSVAAWPQDRLLASAPKAAAEPEAKTAPADDKASPPSGTAAHAPKDAA